MACIVSDVGIIWIYLIEQIFRLGNFRDLVQLEVPDFFDSKILFFLTIYGHIFIFTFTSLIRLEFASEFKS